MEFNFRAVDDRPSPPSSFFDHRSEPPFPSPMQASSVPSIVPCYPNNGLELALRDREREMMIREEIILHEIARRREIEFEVRRDILLLEREMAAIRAGFLFDCGSRAMPWLPHVHWPSQPPPLPHRSSTTGPMPMMPANSSGAPEPLALPPRDAANDLNAASKANSDKLIVLDRPNPDLIGTKRKAIEVEPHLAVAPDEKGPVDLNKKPKVEWSCATCQVQAPTEKAFNAHLLGKKHMGMVKRLKIQNSCIENVIRISDSNSKPKTQDENLLMRIEAENISNKYKIVPNNKSKDDKVDGVSSNSAASKGKKLRPKKRKTKQGEKIAFWCEMCQISCPSTEAEGHKRGRKHMAKLKTRSKSHEMTIIAPLITTCNSSDDIVLKPEVTDSTHEPNGMLPKAVIVSKQKALKNANDLDKSDGPAS